MNKEAIFITAIISFFAFCSFYKNEDDIVIKNKKNIDLIAIEEIQYSYDQYIIKKEFSQFPLIINNYVLLELEVLLSKKRFLQKVFRNSKYFFPTIEYKLKEKGLPEKLKFLPVIESGLNNLAVSPAGAIGMWQFTDTTARQFGLRNKHGIDERKNFIRATEVACKYLKYLYRRNNDWYLTLAAYNAGPTFIKNVINQSQEKKFFLLTESGLLKDETIKFIPRFIAMYFIFKYADQLCPEIVK